MSTTNITSKIRQILNDNSTSGSDVFTYENSPIFTLSEPNILSVTEVYVNSTESSVIHSFNATTNRVTISSALLAGDSVQIEYTYYPNYSNTELVNYMNAGLTYFSINNYGDYVYDTSTDDIFPQLEPREENLLAIITATLIDPDNRTIKLPDITIQTPNNMSTPERISKYISNFKRGSTHGVFDIV